MFEQLDGVGNIQHSALIEVAGSLESSRSWLYREGAAFECEVDVEVACCVLRNSLEVYGQGVFVRHTAGALKSVDVNEFDRDRGLIFGWNRNENFEG